MNDKPPQPPQTPNPLEENPPFYWPLVLLGPLLLGLSLGLQLMMSAMFLWGPAPSAVVASDLTKLGEGLIRPERDLPIYVFGIALSVALAIGAVTFWRRRGQAQAQERQRPFALASAGLQAVIAVASMALYLVVLSGRFAFLDVGAARQASNRLDELVIFLPTLLGAFCAVWDTLRWNAPGPSTGVLTARRLSGRALDVIVPVVIVLALFIPSRLWPDLAGQFLLKDNLHHWNYFLMGPAMFFAHGAAFETDFYSQYGIGWPFLIVLLKPILPMTYANAMGVAMICGCVYYVGVYLLLRLLLRNGVFAVLGVLLAISWQMFSGMDRNTIIWMYPSSTMLRHPMDVWFFLALLLYARKGKSRFLALAGMFCGLGLFFETDTGIYLFATAVGYALLRWLQDRALPADNRKRPGLVRPAALFVAGATAVTLPLLYVASRGTVLTTAFWSGLAQCIREYAGGGASMLPVSSVEDGPIMLFLFMMALYLSVITLTLVQCLHRKASSQGILLASISLYGLALLLVFVGRSHPYNLYHPMAPFAIVLAACLYYGWRKVQPLMQRSILPSGLAVGVLVLLLTKPTFLEYPSPLAVAFSASPEPGVLVRQDPADLRVPGELGNAASMMQAVAQELRRLSTQGDVAILEKDDTVLYYLADLKPWGRYCPLCNQISTRTMLRQVLDEMDRRRPRHVVMLADAKDVPEGFEDTWQEFRRFLSARYSVSNTIGPFSIWQVRP